jgi:hypothetical protein
MNVRRASAPSEQANPHTTSRRNLAYAMVAKVGHKHVAARIDGHAIGTVEAGVGTRPDNILSRGAAHAASDRCNRCMLSASAPHSAYQRTPPTVPAVVIVVKVFIAQNRMVKESKQKGIKRSQAGHITQTKGEGGTHLDETTHCIYILTPALPHACLPRKLAE